MHWHTKGCTAPAIRAVTPQLRHAKWPGFAERSQNSASSTPTRPDAPTQTEQHRAQRLTAGDASAYLPSPIPFKRGTSGQTAGKKEAFALPPWAPRWDQAAGEQQGWLSKGKQGLAVQTVPSISLSRQAMVPVPSRGKRQTERECHAARSSLRDIQHPRHHEADYWPGQASEHSNSSGSTQNCQSWLALLCTPSMRKTVQ